MKYQWLVLCLSTFLSTTLFAQQSVEGSNQKTIVDEGGNLKMIDSNNSSNPQSSPTMQTSPDGNQPSQSVRRNPMMDPLTGTTNPPSTTPNPPLGTQVPAQNLGNTVPSQNLGNTAPAQNLGNMSPSQSGTSAVPAEQPSTIPALPNTNNALPGQNPPQTPTEAQGLPSSPGTQMRPTNPSLNPVPNTGLNPTPNAPLNPTPNPTTPAPTQAPAR